jgi:importin subunit beta-1
LIECIQNVSIDDEDQEDDELGVALSAGCCLAAVAIVIGNTIMEPVIAFVSQNIMNQEWKKRYSALLALGAITEGPEKTKYMNVIIPALPNLINMFADPHGKVREAIAWVMSKICEHHADVIANYQTLPTLIPVYINALRDKPRISN